MRPRISKAEAAYILQVLQATQTMLREKQQRLEWLQAKVAELRKIKQYDLYTAVIKERLNDKQQELQRLEQEAFDLHLSLNLHYRLIQKYTAIANGEPHDGRYKHLSLTNSGVTFPRRNVLAEVATA